MLILLFFAFLSGLITILTPCIWPLLPIVLSASINGSGHKRPLGITLGIMLSFAFFTLAISSIVMFFHFDPNVLRLVAVVIIGILGLSLIIPKFSLLLELLINRMTSVFGNKVNRKGNDFSAGFVTGLMLGIVWSPCAGPILAAIATLAATGKVSFEVVLITLSYTLGVGIPLFLFAYGGQRVFVKTKFISKYTGRIQQVFGVVMILTALAIYTNYDVYLQNQFLNAFPIFNSTINSFENNSTLKKQIDVLKGNGNSNSLTNSELFNTNTPSPDFSGGTQWLNSEKPLKLSDLKGKVVLVDFWTYTCINCIRTLPHITSWYNKYQKDGFVVIGVHTPEFQFEHDTANVQNAIKMFGIKYPVVQDNNYTIWNSFSNQYWPAEYLIDSKGNIRRVHFGEGEYDQTEMAIQELLKAAGQNPETSFSNMPDLTPQTQLSPETYLGSDRMEFYYPDGNTGAVNKNFTLLISPPQNSFSLGGGWNISGQSATTSSDSVLTYNFYANKVFLVLNPGNNKTAKIKVLLDGKTVDSSNAGMDVRQGEVTVDTDRLYNLIDLKGNAGSHVLKLEFETSGIEAFAFTFG